MQRGRARFELDGERVEAPAGTFVFVRPGVKRTAFAEEPGRRSLPLAALSLAASANRPTGLPEGVGPHGLWVWQAPRDGQENGLREAAPPTPRLSALMAASEALAVL